MMFLLAAIIALMPCFIISITNSVMAIVERDVMSFHINFDKMPGWLIQVIIACVGLISVAGFSICSFISPFLYFIYYFSSGTVEYILFAFRCSASFGLLYFTMRSFQYVLFDSQPLKGDNYYG